MEIQRVGRRRPTPYMELCKRILYADLLPCVNNILYNTILLYNMSRNRSGLGVHKRIYKCCPFIIPDPPPQIVSTDLLIHFEANDLTSYSGSGTTWVNIGTGGATYNGTLLGSPAPSFVNGAIKSFQFSRNFLSNGTDYLNYNYIRFLRPDAISDDFTYCAWIKTTNVGQGVNHYNFMYIVSTETGGVNNDFGFGIDVNGKLAYGDGKTGGSDITIQTTQSVNTGVWTFVAVTRKKSTGRVVLYINGLPVITGTCNVGNTLSTATYVIIGSETDFPGYTFGGNIGALLGNTSVLSDADILNNFNAQRATYGV